MTRSPLFYPMNRGGDTEAGGAADLQTDVMRFMAILSLCLVAIFALVQSIPLSPAPVQEEQEPDSESTLLVSEPEVEIDATQNTVELVRPRIKRHQIREEYVSLSRPRPTPVSAIPKPKPVPAMSAPPLAAESVVAEQPAASKESGETGFTLRFEDNAALTRLVERQVVGFYAIGPGSAFRMSIEGNTISFWEASIPGQFHEMDIATVPAAVLSAYRRTNGTANVKWGVTLPANMSQDLNTYLNSESGGSLIIAANGDIELRH